MTRLDRLLANAGSNRLTVCALAAILVAVIAWGDWQLPNTSIGFLYLIPILLAAPALRGLEISILAVLCAYLREAADPLQGVDYRFVANPARWISGSWGRLLVAVAGFGMTGFFVAELNRRRTMLSAHLKEQEEQMRLRQETERQLRILIDTSPPAILPLDAAGRVQLANESAAQLLGFDGPLQGTPVEPYLPLLARMLQSHHSGGNIRTNVECRGQRHNGEVFLAHVWLSTYRTAGGVGLAA